MEVSNGAFWTEKLVDAVTADGIPLGSEGTLEAGSKAVSRRKADQWSKSEPGHYFLASVLTGRVEKQKRFCPHALEAEPAILVRTSGWWLLGCVECVSADLMEGQDSRCDWCGDMRPDKTPTVTFTMGPIRLVAQFCPAHMARLGLAMVP